MLGNILGVLTNAATAEDLLSVVADDALRQRIRAAADENSLAPGAYVAATVRHLLDHGSEEIWLDLVGRMANSPQPGVAALNAILARAFPAENSDVACGHGAEVPGRAYGHPRRREM